MNKQELKDLIKKLTKDIIGNKEEEPTPEKELPLTTKYNRFDLLIKFPEMIPVLSDLMTNDFELFIKDIYWVAPKPTTFKFELINGQYFFLMYYERSWMVQIEGKKYYLLDLPEAELASEAISRILRYGNISKSPTSLESSSTPEETPSSESPAEETPSPESPPEETPA
jgi:hypothetical protein